MAATLIGFILLMFILYFTTLDTKIFKLTLSGHITDLNNKAVANAAVYLGDTEMAQTDTDGSYSIGGLEIGQYKIKIVENGFNTLSQDIAINRSFLNYTITHDFKLTPSGIGDIKLRLIAPDTAYRFLDDQLTLDDKSYKINADGQVTISGTETSQQSVLKFTSVNFVDFTRTFEIKAGANDLGEITLQTAGDIVGPITSYIRETPLPDIQITVEGVDPKFITVDSTKNTFRVQDLETDKEYKLRAQRSGYLTRDYTIKVAQGENQIFNFRMVENGLIPFLRPVKANGSTDLQIFVSEFDGANTKQLTQGDTQPYGEFIQQDTVYYASTRDNLQSGIGGKVLVPYTVNTTGTSIKRLTNVTTGIGTVLPNFIAKLMTNIHKPADSTKQKHRLLDVTDLQVSKSIQIEDSGTGTFTSTAISNDGKKVFYVLQETPNTRDGLYIANIDGTNKTRLSSKNNINIYSISSDGSRVIYEAQNPTSKLQDLYFYDTTTSQENTLKVSFAGSQYQFLNGSNTQIIFQEYRDGGSNLFLLDTASNTDQRLTNFSGTEGVDTIYQQAGYVIYQTNKGMYIIDPATPKPNKLITSSFSRYTGYDL